MKRALSTPTQLHTQFTRYAFGSAVKETHHQLTCAVCDKPIGFRGQRPAYSGLMPDAKGKLQGVWLCDKHMEDEDKARKRFLDERSTEADRFHAKHPR